MRTTPARTARLSVLFAAASSFACATAGAREYPGMRYGPECDAARAAARSATPPATLRPPTMSRAFVPPQPVPDQVRGDTAVVEVRVDSLGQPIRSSIRISGVSDRNYESRLQQYAEEFVFRPGEIEGCAVEATARVTYRL